MLYFNDLVEYIEPPKYIYPTYLANDKWSKKDHGFSKYDAWRDDEDDWKDDAWGDCGRPIDKEEDRCEWCYTTHNKLDLKPYKHYKICNDCMIYNIPEAKGK